MCRKSRRPSRVRATRARGARNLHAVKLTVNIGSRRHSCGKTLMARLKMLSRLYRALLGVWASLGHDHSRRALAKPRPKRRHALTERGPHESGHARLRAVLQSFSSHCSPLKRSQIYLELVVATPGAAGMTSGAPYLVARSQFGCACARSSSATTSALVFGAPAFFTGIGAPQRSTPAQSGFACAARNSATTSASVFCLPAISGCCFMPASVAAK